ncbi:MAG: hypothetical protein HWE08_08620 [Alphaproteobacteria bacterium]|nr:hypothetical protein [Alphaproteobacteria bacterium]
MTDDQFMSAFEDATLDPNLFDHEAHIRMGWLYVTRYPLTEAIDRFASSLKRLTKALGAEAKYHETITWFYMLLIADRQALCTAKSFDGFLAANTDLVGKPSVLTRYYHPKTLASVRARTHYVLPDMVAGKEAA